MKTIFIIGSMNMDMIVTAPRFAKQGESLVGQSFSTAHGGKGANQAVAAARLGGRVKMCATVGADAFGTELKIALENEKINTAFVAQSANSTGVALITVAGGDNSIVVIPGANEDLTPERATAFLQDALPGDILLVQLETDFDAVKTALCLGKQKGMVTVVNPAPANPRAKELCTLADYMIPNETELEAIADTQEIETGLPRLFAMGVKVPMATLGGAGCAYYDGEKVICVPCKKVTPVDTTAAGDTFCGALCQGLAGDMAFADALRRALDAATLSVTRAGAQPGIPYAEELQ